MAIIHFRILFSLGKAREKINLKHFKKLRRKGRKLFPCEAPGAMVNFPLTKMEWLCLHWGQHGV